MKHTVYNRYIFVCRVNSNILEQVDDDESFMQKIHNKRRKQPQSNIEVMLTIFFWSLSLISSPILRQKSDNCSPLVPLLPRPDSLRHFRILEIEIRTERKNRFIEALQDILQ